MIKFSQLSDQERENLVIFIFPQIEEAIREVITESSKEKFFEVQFFSETLYRITKTALSVEQLTRLTYFLNAMYAKYYDVFPEEEDKWLPNYLYPLFDSLQKESEHISSLYRRSRPGSKDKSATVRKEFKVYFEDKAGKKYEPYSSMRKKDEDIVYGFWKEMTFSSARDAKDEPSELEHLDSLFVCLPKWVDSFYSFRRRGRFTYKNFITLLKQYLKVVEPHISSVVVIASHALDNLPVINRSDIEDEVRQQNAQKTAELEKLAAMKIAKKGDKEELSKLRKIKKTAKDELKVLQEKEEKEVNRRIRKVDNDRTSFEKLLNISENYRERVLYKVTKVILNELTKVRWSYGESGTENAHLKYKAKRTVNAFVKQCLN